MKKNSGRKTALSLVLTLLLIPLFWLQSGSFVFAATPSFKESTVEISGEGEKYQLDIVNKVNGSTYKWSSSNTKVARVSSKGVVTSVGKGTAKIKCKITYPTKKTKTLTCKVTVIIPATKIKINNAKEVNGAHVLKVGETYDFNRDIEPSNSSDKTYWAITEGDVGCIEVVNDSKGVVKALKPGIAVLRATAARKATAEEASKSIVNDAVIIRVEAPTATVRSAEIVDSTQIKVVFDSPIDASTVIGANNTLLDTISITLTTNIKGVTAADPGKLTAALSDDKMTLTINSSNRFDGEYGINFSSNIKTTSGIAIQEYYKRIRYDDTMPPTILDTVLDDTGMIATIRFSEAIDFSGLKVSNAALLPGQSATALSQSTVQIINNRNNYIPSEDKKSLTINLSGIAYTDYNKIITVAISGIKDMAGNPPANSYLTAYLRTDNSVKPQARPISVVRSSYYTLTATFDRSLKEAGYATLVNGSYMVGTIDEKDPKKVHYTLSESDAQKTGAQTVNLSGWYGAYNVDPNDTTSYKQYSFTVRFDVDKSLPVLLNQDFDSKTNVLTLTYNKEVTLSNNTGILVATLVTINDEIIPYNNITYTKLESNDPKVIKIQLGNMTSLGYYTFTLDKTFVTDTFKNYATEKSITVNNIEGNELELAGPYMVTQSTTNPSQIYLEFANMLDVPSAQDIRNYTIPGVTIISAKVEKNTKDQGATVILTVADGSIDISLERPLKISGVKSYSGNYAPISDFSTTVYLKDNKKPYYIKTVFDKNNPTELHIRFSEEITGEMTVRVIQQYGSTSYEIGNTVTISGTDVVVNLFSTPIQNSYLKIEILSNQIKDLNGNEVAPMNTILGVVAAY